MSDYAATVTIYIATICYSRMQNGNQGVLAVITLTYKKNFSYVKIRASAEIYSHEIMAGSNFKYYIGKFKYE